MYENINMLPLLFHDKRGRDKKINNCTFFYIFDPFIVASFIIELNIREIREREKQTYNPHRKKIYM